MCKELDEMLKRAEDRGVKRGEKIDKERGRSEARADIINTYINRCKAGGKSEEVIISDLEQYFDYSRTEACELYAKYAG